MVEDTFGAKKPVPHADDATHCPVGLRYMLLKHVVQKELLTQFKQLELHAVEQVTLR